MSQIYVSDFENFMDQYIRVHPEVIEEQQQGWCLYWEPKIDHTAPGFGKEDFVRDDHYGFH